MQKITEKITVAGHTAELVGYTIEKKKVLCQKGLMPKF